MNFLFRRLIPSLSLHYMSIHTMTLVFLRLMREYGIGVGLYARPNFVQTQVGTLWLENIRACVGEGRGRRLVQVGRGGWFDLRTHECA